LLLNVIYKILTKVLTLRLTVVAEKVNIASKISRSIGRDGVGVEDEMQGYKTMSVLTNLL
jgi:hypothetical protein